LSISQEIKRIARDIGANMALPPVRDLLLPPLARELGKIDEFGFVVLEDDSVGPLYVSLGETLPRLHRLRRELQGSDAMALVAGLGGADAALSALALGAFNALSQHLMQRAGFDPTAVPKAEKPAAARRLGMVGYFPPLAERYLAQGSEFVVIEKDPARVPQVPGILLSTEPAALADCDQVICTASTLINDTLAEILAACPPGSTLALTGPSASCLPDPLFGAGVATVGGVRIERPDDLAAALELGDSWSECGRKYQLAPGDYPGVAQLMAAALS
jgi:uncharacterized protein (DUF4213/DUF364 family)